MFLIATTPDFQPTTSKARKAKESKALIMTKSLCLLLPQFKSKPLVRFPPASAVLAFSFMRISTGLAAPARLATPLARSNRRDGW